MRNLVKKGAQFVFLAFTLPYALLSGFGRVRWAYTIGAHRFAMVPGILGDYTRAAYYKWTLRDCSIDTRIHFGTILAHPDAVIGDHVSIGCYCVIGRARIGARTQVSSHVEIPSGRYQHDRDAAGKLQGSLDGEVKIGSDCWIGASAIVMADVGDGATIGAGAVVVKEIPPGCVAVGNPARIIRRDAGNGAAT